MALTLEMEQKLDRVSLIAYFKANESTWQANVQDAYDFTKKAFSGAKIRPDDVAKVLRPVVEIDKPLRRVLDQKKLSQKYWVDYFNFLVIDRAWETLAK